MLFRFNISFCKNNGLGKNIIYVLLILSAYALHTCSGYVLLIQINKMHERMNVWITTFWGFCIDTKYLRLLYHLQNKRLICYLKSSHRSTIDDSFTIFADTLLRVLNGSIIIFALSSIFLKKEIAHILHNHCEFVQFLPRCLLTLNN